MEDIKNQLINRLKEANNVLVAVTNNPTVDQLAAAIGLTLILNKLNKHATTVFSGTIPSTIEFLKPEKTIEKNTDSLRDFIISLDKTKADKLRYKIEDQYVKIFITPYHTSINQNDLVFSQGDFNVDVVLGLGVQQREELDQAITIHGRILHDATVATITTDPPSTLGSINFAEKTSSSLCEILVGLLPLISKDNVLDGQIATALLTGIVAETQRFSNQRTTANTMTVSSKLLAAEANQQLVAQELTPKAEEPKPEPIPEVKPQPVPAPPTQPLPPVKEEPKPEPPKDDSGTLKIEHPKNAEDDLAQVLIDDQGTLKTVEEPKIEELPEEPEKTSTSGGGHSLISKSNLTSLDSVSEEGDNNESNTAGIDDLPSGPTQSNQSQDIASILSEDKPSTSSTNDQSYGGSSKLVIQPPPQPHLNGAIFNNPTSSPTDTDLAGVRSAVDAAIASSPGASLQPPIQALNANPMDMNLNNDDKDSGSGSNGSATPPPPVPPPILPPDMTAI